MSEHPKPENYDSDSDFLDAMADHYGIDRRMLRYIPFPKMSTHDDDTCPHLVRANLLEAENARLKPELERYSTLVKTAHVDLNAQNARLKSEVERLTKAGDAMAIALNLNDDVFDNHEKKLAQSAWNAAKEGKQP